MTFFILVDFDKGNKVLRQQKTEVREAEEADREMEYPRIETLSDFPPKYPTNNAVSGILFSGGGPKKNRVVYNAEHVAVSGRIPCSTTLRLQ